MYERIEAEECLISCLIADLKVMEQVYGMLSPDMFDNGVLGCAFNEYRKAFDEKKDLTVSELQQRLESAGFKDYEIEDAIRKAINQKCFGFQITGYANAVVAHWKKTCVDSILNRIEVKEGSVDDQIEGLIKDLEDLRGGKTSEGHTVAELTEQYKDDYFSDRDVPLIFVNDEDIDGMTGGFQNGDLVLLGARPATGKSALAVQWAETFAKAGAKVAYYNCEMQERNVFERFVAAKSGIEITRIRRAKAFLNEEKRKYDRAVEELLNQHGITLYTGAKKVSEIRKDVREKKFNIVVVDYLQLLIADSRYSGNRTAEVGQISRDLKNLAMDMNTVVFALSQLNRSSEGRSDRRPSVADLRESGSLEQDASIIFLLWDSNIDDRTQKMLAVSKSRNGKCGEIQMTFDGAHLHFTNENRRTPFD